MAFKTAALQVVPPAESAGPFAVAIDFDHLNRQTVGDRYLQRQVLKMFLRHSQEQIERLRAAQSIGARREAAHSLVGSSRGVGAFAMAAIAAEVETAKGPVNGRLEALAAAAAAARAAIEAFLAA
jgi:HPt (histidine-containing phosphotransfer) domain-containing protein